MRCDMRHYVDICANIVKYKTGSYVNVNGHKCRKYIVALNIDSGGVSGKKK